MAVCGYDWGYRPYEHHRDSTLAPRFFQQFGRPIAILAAFASPFLVWGGLSALGTSANNVLDWLPASFEETQRLSWFATRFGTDEILVVSWPGCALEDERLDSFADLLVQPVPGGPDGPLFRRVFTGRQTLNELTSEPAGLSSEVAIDRMQDWLVGPDRETTCAVAMVSRAGEQNRELAMRWVRQAAEMVGVASEELWMGGPTADTIAISQAAQQGVISAGFVSALLALTVAWICLKEFRLVWLVFAAAFVAWGLSLSAVWVSGQIVDAVLMMMPALVFVLTVSGAVHLTHYYRQARQTHEPTLAPGEAIRRGWLPCTLASITTAMGIGSLSISKVWPVARFGVFASLGVLFSLFALLLIWPSSAVFLTRNGKRAPTPAHPVSRARWWQPAYVIATAYYPFVLTVAGIGLPFLLFGTWQIRTSAQMEDLIPKESRLMSSYRWLETNVGPLVPVEIVLRFSPVPDDDRNSMLKRAELVEAIRAKVAGRDDTAGPLCITTLLPEIPKKGGARQLVRRKVIARQLHNRRREFEDLRLIYQDEKESLWRISVRANAKARADYGEYLASLEAGVTAYLRDSAVEDRPSVEICGGAPLVYMAQKQLLKDLINSFLSAFVLIAVTMIILMRSVSGGLLSMIPNVFPALVVFGAMGWMGTAIDIGTMMTASAAMGIAVDDTLHYLVWFRRATERGLNRVDAIRSAFEHCATAMLQTSIICGLGMLVFCVIPFTPISRFATIMATLLFTALFGDLIVLSAVLASPVGTLLCRSPAVRTRG